MVRAAIDRQGDRELLAAVAGGDAGAARGLLQQHTRRATAVVTRVLRDRGDVEEIVQETLLELWQRSRHFDPRRGSAAAWVTAIARSRAIDRLRANVRASRALDSAAVVLEPAAVPTPDQLLDRRRDDRRVHAALDVLSPVQSAVVRLTFWGDLSQIEIAGQTGAPLSTVKLRLRTAMAALARLISRRRADGR